MGNSNPFDLNTAILKGEGNYSSFLKDNSTKTQEVDVFFKNIKKSLLSEIETADAVFGCVAWLTDLEIIEALSKKELVSIIVQKENFLRTNTEENIGKWKKELREKYASISPNLRRDHFDNILKYVSTNENLIIDPIRCVGSHNKDKALAFPRMHNKFLIFCEKKTTKEETTFTPHAVWTGSFNFTKNAGNSMENAVILRNESIINAYLEEFSQICALSEPLDWNSDNMEPEWRLGT